VLETPLATAFLVQRLAGCRLSDSSTWACSTALHLAQLVFGAERVGAALDEATAVLDRWGYRSQVRDGEYKLPACSARRC